MRLDAALHGHRPVRRLQRRARPHQHALDVAPGQHDGLQRQRQFLARAPDRQAHFRRAHHGVHVREAVDDLAVHREQEVARLQQPGRRRTRPPAGRPSAPCGASGCAPSRARSRPPSRPSWRASASESRPNSISAEYSVRSPRAYSSISCTSDAGTPMFCCTSFAPVLVGEARPERGDVAALVDDDAVEIRRAIHEPQDLEVGVAELERARQREPDRPDRGHGRLLRRDAVVALQADDVHGLAGRRHARRELSRLDRRVAELPRVVADHGEVVQRMHVLDRAVHLDRAREGQAHVPERRPAPCCGPRRRGRAPRRARRRCRGSCAR